MTSRSDSRRARGVEDGKCRSRSFELLLVAKPPLLVVEHDELTVAHACGAASVGEEHEREQRMHFRFVWHELDKGTAHRDAPIAICAL